MPKLKMTPELMVTPELEVALELKVTLELKVSPVASLQLMRSRSVCERMRRVRG